jgi:hypothetical protein
LKGNFGHKPRYIQREDDVMTGEKNPFTSQGIPAAGWERHMEQILPYSPRTDSCGCTLIPDISLYDFETINLLFQSPHL